MNPYKIYTGRVIDLEDPRPESVCIDSIAWSLAHIYRYTGHAPHPISVAEHSIRVADVVDPKPGRMRTLALVHDAHEAYVGDMSRPVQHLAGHHHDLGGDVWRHYADQWQRAIFDAMSIAPPTRDEQVAIDAADSAECERELADQWADCAMISIAPFTWSEVWKREVRS